MQRITEKNPKPYLTVREVAELLSVNPHTIYNLIYKGELASVKVGTAVRVARVDLERYLKGGGDGGS